MAHDPDAGPRSAKPLRSNALVVFALIIGIFLGVLSVGLIGWAMLSHGSERELLSHVWSAVTGRTLSIDVSQPTVVDRIQRLQRLETVVYTMDKVVTGAKENPIFPDFLAGDRLLMLVHGEVVAGIDFTDLKPGDVRVNGKQIQLHLPAAQVPDSDRQREDAGLFQANRAAGTYRPESGNASAPGGGTSAARGRTGRWHFANRPAECVFHDQQSAAGSGIRED
jgi:hypothetical protein